MKKVAIMGAPIADGFMQKVCLLEIGNTILN